MQDGVSIIIPHYKTESLVRLCLRSIRYYTKKPQYEVLVVDNGSADDPSLTYLRRLKWIKLIEREPKDDSPSDIHKQAMDIGIARASFPYILSFHTDSIPIHEDWLSRLLDMMLTEDLAAIGSYKLELKSPLEMFFKKIEETIKGKTESVPYIRSHCALYRRDLLEKLNLRFVSEEMAGKNIHFGLLKAGYKVKILPPRQLLLYVVHLNHGTMILRPELGARRKTIRRGCSRIQAFLARPEIQKIYNDENLDG